MAPEQRLMDRLTRRSDYLWRKFLDTSDPRWLNAMSNTDRMIRRLEERG